MRTLKINHIFRFNFSLLLLVFSCLLFSPSDSFSSIKSKQTDFTQVLFWHPFRQKRNWPEGKELKFEKRILTSNPTVLNYLYLLNKKNGLSQMVTPAVVSEKELNDLASALASLPEIFRKQLEHKFKGVFLVSGMRNYGLAEYIQDERGTPWGGVIFLDMDKLRSKSLNALATEKERQLLGGNGELLVSSVMIDPKRDSHLQALRYVLFHEIADLLAVGHNFHPNWWQAPPRSRFSNYSFTKESWEMNDELSYGTKNKSLSKISNASITEGHGILLNSSFLSLYALTNPFEDFAESVALTLWEKEGNSRYWIIRNDNKLKVLPLPKALSQTFQAKKKLLDQILSHN